MRACLQFAAFLFTLTCLSAARATIIQDDAIGTTVTHGFSGVGTVDSILDLTEAAYGERFAGQTLTTVGFDALSGSPGSPLTLLSGGTDLNLRIQSGVQSGDPEFLLGCGPATCSQADGIGEGAISILLDEDATTFGVTGAAADPDPPPPGGTNVTLQFFSRTGALLGVFDLLVGNTFYGFRVTSGPHIAGVSITNTDFLGLGIETVSFNVDVPEPATGHLLALGLLGLGVRRRRH